MSAPNQQGIPQKINAGDTLIFTDTLTDYPASLWTMQFSLVTGATPPTITTATADGDNFQVEISAADTAKLASGKYLYAEVVTEIATSRKYTARTGEIQVLPSLLAAQQPTAAQTLLAACDTAFLKLAGTTDAEVNFNGQMFRKRDIAALQKIRTQLQAEVSREQQKADSLRGRVQSGRIETEFVPVGGAGTYPYGWPYPWLNP